MLINIIVVTNWH